MYAGADRKGAARAALLCGNRSSSADIYSPYAHSPARPRIKTVQSRSGNEAGILVPNCGCGHVEQQTTEHGNAHRSAAVSGRHSAWLGGLMISALLGLASGRDPQAIRVDSEQGPQVRPNVAPASHAWPITCAAVLSGLVVVTSALMYCPVLLVTQISAQCLGRSRRTRPSCDSSF